MSLVDPSDPAAVFKTVTELGSQVQATGQKRLKVSEQSSVKIGEITTDLLAGFRSLNEAAETEFERGKSSLDNLENLSRMPPIFRRVMSIFDPSFSRSAQKLNLQRSQLNLENISRKGNILEKMASFATGAVSAANKTAELEHEVAKGQFQNFVDVLGAQGTIFENLNKSTQLAIDQTPLSELQSYARGNAEANVPEVLKRQPGLIEQTIVAKMAARASLTSTQLGNTAAQMNIAERQAEKFLGQLEDGQLLQLMNNPSQLPEGISRKDVENQLLKNRIEIAQTSTAEQAAAKGELDLANQVIDEALEKDISIEQMTSLIQNAQQKGQDFAVVRGQKVPLQRLDDALTKRLTEKPSGAVVTLRMTEAVAKMTMDQNKVKTARLAQASNPGQPVDPLNPLPDLRAENTDALARAQVEYNTLLALQKEGIETAVPLSQAADKYSEELAKAETAYLDRFGKKEAREGAREFLSSGVITNSLNASAILVQEAANPNAMADNPVLDPIFRDFSVALDEEIRKSGETGFDPAELETSGGAFVFTKKDRAPEQNIVATAVEASGARDKVASRITQSELAQAIATLHNTMSDENGNSPFMGIVNPQNNRFNPAITRVEDTFSFGRLTEFFAARSAKMQAEGALSGDQSLMDMVINRVIENNKSAAQTSNRYFGQDATSAAFLNAVNFNDPRRDLFEKLNAVSAISTTALQSALELVTQDEQGKDDALSRLGINPKALTPEEREKMLGRIGRPPTDPFIDALRTNIGPEEKPAQPGLITEKPSSSITPEEVKKMIDDPSIAEDRKMTVEEISELISGGIPFNEIFPGGQEFGGQQFGGQTFGGNRFGAQAPFRPPPGSVTIPFGNK